MEYTLSKEVKEKYMRLSAEIDKLESLANDVSDAGAETEEIYELVNIKREQMEKIRERALDHFIDDLLREKSKRNRRKIMENKELKLGISLSIDINKAIKLGRKHIEENHCDKTKEEQDKIFLEFVVDHVITNAKYHVTDKNAD